MTFEPLLSADLMVQIHVAFAVPALILGPVALFAPLRGRAHRLTGYTWMACLVGLSLSAFAIPSLGFAVVGPFGPIHLLAVLALYGVWDGIRLARARRLAEHGLSMRWLWFGTMGVAGLLNFLPGRTINRMAFGEPSEAGYFVIALGALLLVALWGRDRTRVLRAA